MKVVARRKEIISDCGGGEESYTEFVQTGNKAGLTGRSQTR